MIIPTPGNTKSRSSFGRNNRDRLLVSWLAEMKYIEELLDCVIG
jgi:hypothetical protein